MWLLIAQTNLVERLEFKITLSTKLQSKSKLFHQKLLVISPQQQRHINLTGTIYLLFERCCWMTKLVK